VRAAAATGWCLDGAVGLGTASWAATSTPRHRRPGGARRCRPPTPSTPPPTSASRLRPLAASVSVGGAHGWRSTTRQTTPVFPSCRSIRGQSPHGWPASHRHNFPYGPTIHVRVRRIQHRGPGRVEQEVVIGRASSRCNERKGHFPKRSSTAPSVGDGAVPGCSELAPLRHHSISFQPLAIYHAFRRHRSRRLSVRCPGTSEHRSCRASLDLGTEHRRSSPHSAGRPVRRSCVGEACAGSRRGRWRVRALSAYIPSACRAASLTHRSSPDANGLDVSIAETSSCTPPFVVDTPPQRTPRSASSTRGSDGETRNPCHRRRRRSRRRPSRRSP